MYCYMQRPLPIVVIFMELMSDNLDASFMELMYLIQELLITLHAHWGSERNFKKKKTNFGSTS